MKVRTDTEPGAAGVFSQRTETADTSVPAGWLSAGKASDLPEGRVLLVVDEDNDLRIAVCNVDGQFFAIEDVCTHDGGSLDQGFLEGEEIECPRHGARFNVTTGQATLMPAVMPVQTFPVKVEGGRLYVGTEPAG